MDLSQAVNQLITTGLQELEEKYGPHSGFHQPYHNATHAEEVMDAAQIIAAEAAIQDHIPSTYVPLLVLAACYHDFVHDRTDGSNESASAQEIATRMRELGLPEQVIAVVGEAIMATRYRIDEGHIRQAVTADYSTLILADADLASAGRPFEQFWARSLKLKEEYGDTSDEATFITSQLIYLQNHNFHTPEAESHFPHHAANIKRLQAMLAN